MGEYWTSDVPISAPMPRDDVQDMERVDMQGLSFTPMGLVFDYTVVDYSEIFLSYDSDMDPDRDMVGGEFSYGEAPPPDPMTAAPAVVPEAPTPVYTEFADIIALGRYIEEFFPPAKCSEHPYFGGVAPIHATGSPHYMERAIDINADFGDREGPDDERILLNQIDEFARENGFTTSWQITGHFDHLHIVDWR